MTLNSDGQTTPSLGQRRRERKLQKLPNPSHSCRPHQPAILFPLTTMAGQENEDREEASKTSMAALDMGTDLMAKLHLPPPQRQHGRTFSRPSGTAHEYQNGSRSPAPSRPAGARAHLLLPLAASAGRKKKRRLSSSADEEVADSLICGAAGGGLRRHHWLRPMEHRDEEEPHPQELDLAGEIQSLTPGMTPNCTQAKNSNKTTKAISTKDPNSGARPNPAPTGYSGGEDVGAAQPLTVDSQTTVAD